MRANQYSQEAGISRENLGSVDTAMKGTVGRSGYGSGPAPFFTGHFGVVRNDQAMRETKLGSRGGDPEACQQEAPRVAFGELREGGAQMDAFGGAKMDVNRPSIGGRVKRAGAWDASYSLHDFCM